MKIKNFILSFLFGLIVLCAIVLQSIHSFNHLKKELTTKECHHKYAKNKTEFTHSHQNLGHCFICEFTFSTSIKSEFFIFYFKKVEIPARYFYFYFKEINRSFLGSLFALRAPPSFVV
jgi:hypothetical protein